MKRLRLVVVAVLATALGCLAPIGLSVAAAAADSDGDGLTNHFEIHFSHTNPLLADTDGNGIPDGAEDPDGDGLSNLAEQHFHTNPLLADTDGDGKPDGRDDANHDGVPDGSEQDLHRMVPINLVPSLSTAANDFPVSYTDGCHVGAAEDRFEECDYGVPHGSLRIALFGDSHAAQWLPALIQLANARGWTIESLTRAGCQYADILRYSKYQHGMDTECQSFRRQAVAWLDANPPDLIVLGSYAGHLMVDASGTFLTPAQSRAAWRQGVDRTLSALPTSSRVMVLSDTPFSPVNPVHCLQAHPTSMGKCERPRSTEVPTAYDTINADVAGEHGDWYASLTDVMCPYDPCPLVVGNVMMFRAVGHLTATFALSLSPSLGRALDGVLAGGAAPSVTGGPGGPLRPRTVQAV